MGMQQRFPCTACPREHSTHGDSRKHENKEAASSKPLVAVAKVMHPAITDQQQPSTESPPGHEPGAGHIVAGQQKGGGWEGRDVDREQTQGGGEGGLEEDASASGMGHRVGEAHVPVHETVRGA